jgi:hypothetical protein
MMRKSREPVLVQFLGQDEVKIIVSQDFYRPIIFQLAIVVPALFFWLLVLPNVHGAIDLTSAILPLESFNRFFPGYHQAVLYVAGNNRLHQILWFAMLATSIMSASFVSLVCLRWTLAHPVRLLPHVSGGLLKLLAAAGAIMFVFCTLFVLLYLLSTGFLGSFDPQRSSRPVFLLMVMVLVLIAFLAPFLLLLTSIFKVAVVVARAKYFNFRSKQARSP